MVIRFTKPSKQRPLPLFDRLEALPTPPRALRLTSRQVEHRKRMLQHLAGLRRAQ
jgi:hypothetical protein